MNQPRVVITGMGAITPLGLTMADTWAALLAGKSGMAEITRFDASILPTRFAAEVKGFDATRYMNPKEMRRTDLHQQYGMAAAQQALAQSGLKATPQTMGDIGVVVGTSVGGHRTMLSENEVLREKGVRRMNPSTIPMVMNNGLVGLLTLTHGFGGPAYCPTSACSTGNDAIGQAFHLIRNRQAIAVLTGGADSTVAALGMAGFAQAGALSTRSESTPRPFDKARDGLLTGEGAACFVFEELGFALARGAPILAEVIGYGITNDGYNMVAPSPGGEGASRAINRAIRDAGIRPDEVDYVNAHGTGTPLNDVVETQALKRTLGNHAYKVAVSSSKSMTGHCMGAAGAIEAAICISVIREGIVPPTINHTDPDPECDLDYTPLEARKRNVRITMNNSFGFGGHNSVTLFKRYEA